MKKENGEIGEQAFGAIKSSLLPCTGDHKPNPAKLNAPLESQDGVIHVFCRGCGVYFESKGAFLEELARESGQPTPEPISGWYAESNTCPICLTAGAKYSVSLKQIPA